MDLDNKKASLFSCFPGTGKTYYYNLHKIYDSVLDSDSSSFSWAEVGVRDDNFPENYIEHIKYSINKYSLILISSHKIVRESLVKNGLDFTLCSR